MPLNAIQPSGFFWHGTQNGRRDACGRTNDGHGIARGRSKSTATGLTLTRGRFDCLYALREEHQRIQRIKRIEQMVLPSVDSSRIRINPAEPRLSLNDEPRRSGSTAFVAVAEGLSPAAAAKCNTRAAGLKPSASGTKPFGLRRVVQNRASHPKDGNAAYVARMRLPT